MSHDEEDELEPESKKEIKNKDFELSEKVDRTSIYEKFAKVGGNVYDVAMETINMVMDQLVKEYENALKNNINARLTEKKLGWLIRIMGAMLTVKESDSSIYEESTKQFEICGKTIQIINLTNSLYEVK